MRLQKLYFRNFRNIAELTIEPDGRLNFFIGANAQGKTSIIEAIHLLATLRSFRGAKVDDLIQNETMTGEIGCEIIQDDSISRFQVVFERKDLLRKRSTQSAFINDKPCRSALAYVSQRFESFLKGFHAIVFNPSDHQLVRGEPSIRRSYLDQVIGSEDLDYLTALRRYKRALEQRNAILKSPETSVRTIFQEFTQELVESGSEITLKRLEWLKRVNENIKPVLQRIAPTQNSTDAFYSSKWLAKENGLALGGDDLNRVQLPDLDPADALGRIRNRLAAELTKLESAEWRAGTTLAGPHRDDWLFQIGSQALKGYGSQGETRSVLLALKLVEIQMFRQATGLNPLLLLDDFSSELDRDRRTFLLEMLLETSLQVFVTTTEDVEWITPREPIALGTSGKKFRVSAGRAAEFISSAESAN